MAKKKDVPAVPGPTAPPSAAAAVVQQAKAIRPRQALNVLEEKLRREYGLVGEIAALLDATLRPVIIAGDLSDPGHAVARGRAWAWSYAIGSTPVGVNVFTLLFGEDVLVEGALVGLQTAGAATAVSLYQTVSGQAIPIAVTQNSGTWRDRRTSAADVPPIQTPAAFNALTGTAETESARIFYADRASPVVYPIKIHVPAGNTLTWRSAGAQTGITLNLWGRIWP